MEIDLEALAANLAALTELAGDVPVYPVVKANGYGHGAVEVAAALEAAGAGGFCVATLDEAAQLRRAGISAAILILYPIPGWEAAEAADLGVAVTAGDVALLEELLAAAPSTPPEPLEIHLEVETGLGRGGFIATELPAAATRIRETQGVRLISAWTHLQAAEDADRTGRQLELFEEATAALRLAGHDLPRHLAASGGILTGDVAALDGVRPGLAIYGLVPDELLADPRVARRGAGAQLRAVMSLHARPVRVRELPSGWGIGYGPSFVTARPSRIATLPLGYGDGWSRALSNRAWALVRGARVPIVGNVAMDAVMVDITDVPGEPVSTADAFVLLGRQGAAEITAADLAAARGTNSWEVVTAMAARLPRVYHARSGPQGIRTLVSDMGPRTRSTRS
ncbi:MAG TPA: alanine racemase [Candidatus Limnocylindrales bacterium]|nr:alanine racemase [Candidatus Limnocylindrales bacterium]